MLEVGKGQRRRSESGDGPRATDVLLEDGGGAAGRRRPDGAGLGGLVSQAVLVGLDEDRAIRLRETVGLDESARRRHRADGAGRSDESQERRVVIRHNERGGIDTRDAHRIRERGARPGAVGGSRRCAARQRVDRDAVQERHAVGASRRRAGGAGRAILAETAVIAGPRVPTPATPASTPSTCVSTLAAIDARAASRAPVAGVAGAGRACKWQKPCAEKQEYCGPDLLALRMRLRRCAARAKHRDCRSPGTWTPPRRQNCDRAPKLRRPGLKGNVVESGALDLRLRRHLEGNSCPRAG